MNPSPGDGIESTSVSAIATTAAVLTTVSVHLEHFTLTTAHPQAEASVYSSTDSLPARGESPSSEVTWTNVNHQEGDQTLRERYTPLHVRSASFSARQSNHTVSALEAACAGFFYDPRHDYPDATVCFSCGLTILKWNEDDKPWEVHQRWSEHCQHVAKYPSRLQQVLPIDEVWKPFLPEAQPSEPHVESEQQPPTRQTTPSHSDVPSTPSTDEELSDILQAQPGPSQELQSTDILQQALRGLLNSPLFEEEPVEEENESPADLSQLNDSEEQVLQVPSQPETEHMSMEWEHSQFGHHVAFSAPLEHSEEVVGSSPFRTPIPHQPILRMHPSVPYETYLPSMVHVHPYPSPPRPMQWAVPVPTLRHGHFPMVNWATPVPVVRVAQWTFPTRVHHHPSCPVMSLYPRPTPVSPQWVTRSSVTSEGSTTAATNTNQAQRVTPEPMPHPIRSRSPTAMAGLVYWTTLTPIVSPVQYSLQPGCVATPLRPMESGCLTPSAPPAPMPDPVRWPTSTASTARRVHWATPAPIMSSVHWTPHLLPWAAAGSTLRPVPIVHLVRPVSTAPPSDLRQSEGGLTSPRPTQRGTPERPPPVRSRSPL